MCWEVLNDEWVSHPTWASEDTGFTTHKKNAFEEALHKSEEERHEYDFHIEAITRTIHILEPIMSRINLMDADERTHFKLKPGIGLPCGNSDDMMTTVEVRPVLTSFAIGVKCCVDYC